MDKKILFLFLIPVLFLYYCSTEIDEGSLSPTAPKVNYTLGTNKPSAPTLGAGYTGSFGNLKATIEWGDPDSSVVSYQLYRDTTLIATIDKRSQNKVFGIGSYIYTDTVSTQGNYAYKILSVGLNGKTNGLVRMIACTNYTNSGNLSGTFYTIINHNGSQEKIYISGAEVLVTDSGGNSKTAYMRTGADGRFSFEKLPYQAGGYTVNFLHPVYPALIVLNISNGYNIITNVHP